MPVITHSDYLAQVSGSGLVALPGLWVRLRNNSTGTDYFSTAVSDAQGAFTHSAVPGDYSAYTGTAATVGGTPTLRNAHYAVPVTAGDDAVLGSATLVVSSPYAATAPPGGVASEVWAPFPGGVNDSVVVQAIIDAMPATGGIIRFWRGTYACNIKVPSFITLRGSGKDSTVLRSVAASGLDVIQSKNFLTLTNTGTNPDSIRGDNFIGIEDLTIDGNVANNLFATTTLNNAILAGATTITFSSAPSGFLNGDTVLLEPGSFGNNKCESVKLISGAGTATWTVAQSLNGLGTVYWAHNAGITIQAARGYGIRVWGRSHRWSNVTIQNCGQDGAWTEFGQDVAFADPTQSLESLYSDIRLINSNGHGWTHRGPHDSNFTNLFFWNHGAYSFRAEQNLPLYNGGVGRATNWMSYLMTHSYYFGTAIDTLCNLTASAASRGNGFEFSGNAGTFLGIGLVSGGHASGLLLTNVTNSIIQHVAINITGDAATLNGTANCILDLEASGCGNGIRVTSEANRNTIRATVNTTAGGQTTLIGTFNSVDSVQLIAYGSGTNTNISQFPQAALQAGGWTPQLPASNGIMAVGLSAGTQMLFGVAGAPNKRPDGSNPVAGDVAWRTDTPAFLGQREYICVTGGATPIWASSHGGGIQTPTEAVLVSGVDCNLGSVVEVTLTAARVVGAPINVATGLRLTYTFIQDGTGGRAVTWNAAFKVSWADTGNTLNKRSSISFIYDGTNWNQDGAQTPYV